jgi:Family of unknown function (DUF5684)
MNNSGGFGLFGIVWLALVVLAVVGFWKLFEKAGKPGWAAIIPIYNIVVMFEIVGKPLWQLLLFLVPFANIWVAITLYVGLCKSFGRPGIGSYLLAIFFGFIYFPYLGFSDDVRYLGPSEGPNANIDYSATGGPY